MSGCVSRFRIGVLYHQVVARPVLFSRVRAPRRRAMSRVIMSSCLLTEQHHLPPHLQEQSRSYGHQEETYRQHR